MNVKGRRLYTYNENYFDIIDSNRKAYWLGWLYADGYNNSKKYTVSLEIQEKDSEILRYMNSDIESTAKISTRIRKDRPTHSPTSTIKFHGEYFSNSLSKLGCINNKSKYLLFPNQNQIPNHLIKSFLLGYYDGNGGCGIYTIEKYKYLHVGIRSTLDFCEGLSKFLSNELNIICKISNDSTSKKITFGNQNSSIRFLDWLYGEHDICLKRKFELYLEAKRHIESNSL